MSRFRVSPKHTDLENFDPNGHYSDWELEKFADALLYWDRENTGEEHGILSESQLAYRERREIQLESGVADQSTHTSLHGQGIFHRTTREGDKPHTSHRFRRKLDGS